MSTTTYGNKSGANGAHVNDAQKGSTENKSSTTPHAQGQGEEGFRVPAAAAAVGTVQDAAGNRDEAAPGVDLPAARDALRRQAKPVFNRGPSVLDFTAVTSAGPTPAGEAAASSASYFDGSRARESHLPDEYEGVEAAATRRRQTLAEAESELLRRAPGGEVRGGDASAPRKLRRETDAGARDEASG